MYTLSKNSSSYHSTLWLQRFLVFILDAISLTQPRDICVPYSTTYLLQLGDETQPLQSGWRQIFPEPLVKALVHPKESIFLQKSQLSTVTAPESSRGVSRHMPASRMPLLALITLPSNSCSNQPMAHRNPPWSSPLKIHPCESWLVSNVTTSYLKTNKLKGPGCLGLFCFSGRERSFVFNQHPCVTAWSQKESSCLKSIWNCLEAKGKFTAKDILN